MQQRFDGPTLEAALEAAVRALGPDLQVIDARRVRTGGVAGFFSREQYEVIAGPGPGRQASPSTVPPSTVPPSTVPATGPATSSPAVGQSGPVTAAVPDEAVLQASIDRTITALIEDVERRSDLAGSPRFADVLAGAAARAGTCPDEALPVVDAEVAPPDADVDTEPAPPAVHGAEGALRWSRQALRRLGVPPVIVDRLPKEPIASEARWIAALTEAIAAEVPPPAEPGPGAELCVSGYGARAAVKILQAGVQGMTPGTLCFDGEAAPATPVVLALAVRACLDS